MNGTTFQRLEELFTAALALAPDARDAYLKAVCAGDDRLKRKLRGLIGAHEADDGFLGVPADSSVTVVNGLGDRKVAGRRIGQYTIRRVIARGGMGIVYEAEQDRPRRIVALKVMRPGLLHASSRQRFQHEVETLGRLQHPNIARIYEADIHEDAAVPGEAVPFFAMEYIEGRPLIEYAVHNHLDTRPRMGLLIQVCQAVHFAHQRGIIHRDLKPENILVVNESEPRRSPAAEQQSTRGTSPSSMVTPRTRASAPTDGLSSAASHDTGALSLGRPKILDFGIAKATGTDVQITTLQTDVGEVIGTVPYMSPEQLLGDSRDLDARSDVYALGVLMFELLAGRLPHDIENKPVAEVMRIVRDEKTPSLSTISKVFRGDIETIVGKAMEKEKTRRYQSAHELAADIERYLTDKPIAARGDSAWYTLQKTLRRHKLVSTLSSLILVVIGVALVVSIGFWRQAVTERDRTETALQEASAVNSFLQDMLGSINPEIARGRIVSVREIVDEASRELDTRFADQPLVRASLHATIGNTYLKLGEYGVSEPHLRSAYDIRLREQGPEHEKTLSSIDDLGRLLTEMERLDEAEQVLASARTTAERVLGPEHESTLSLQKNYAYLLDWQGRVDEAEALYRSVLAIEKRSFDDHHHATLVTMNNLATMIELKGDYAGAEELYQEVYETRLRNLGPDHPATLLAQSNLAQGMANLGRLSEAESTLRQAKAGMERILGHDHPTTLNTINSLGTCLNDQGRYAESEKLYRENMEILRRVLGPTHDATMLARNNIATALISQDRFAEAEVVLKEDLAVFRNKYGDEDYRTLTRMHNLASAIDGQKRFGESEALLRTVLETRRRVLGDLHPDTLSSLNNLAWNLFDQGRAGEAEPMFRQAVDGYSQTMPEGHWIVAVYRGGLGNCLTSLQRFEEAEALLLESYEVEHKVLGPDHKFTKKVAGYLEELYEAWGYPEKAAEYRTLSSMLESSGEESDGDAGSVDVTAND